MQQGLLPLGAIVWVADCAAEAALLFGLRLERFPDHRGLGILGRREHAVDGLAGCPVDPHPANAGRRNERHLGLVLERGLRPLLPDRRRNPAALRITAERSRRVIAQIDAGDDVGRSADEPDVGRAVGRSGLAEQRPVEVAQHGGRAALDDAFHDVHHLERRHRVEQLPRAVRRPRHRLAVPVGRIAIAHDGAAIVGAVDDLAVAVLDIVDGRRLHRPALVGKHRIGVGQAQAPSCRRRRARTTGNCHNRQRRACARCR